MFTIFRNKSDNDNILEHKDEEELEVEAVNDIRDDEDGNLYDFAFSGSYAAYKSSSYDRTQGIDSAGSGSQIGNVFYEQGLLVITDTGSYSQVGRGTSYSLEFQATQRHYEYEYKYR